MASLGLQSWASIISTTIFNKLGTLHQEAAIKRSLSTNLKLNSGEKWAFVRLYTCISVLQRLVLNGLCMQKLQAELKVEIGKALAMFYQNYKNKGSVKAF